MPLGGGLCKPAFLLEGTWRIHRVTLIHPAELSAKTIYAELNKSVLQYLHASQV